MPPPRPMVFPRRRPGSVPPPLRRRFRFRLPAGAGHLPVEAALLPAARGGAGGWRARRGPCPRACCWGRRAVGRASWPGGCVISGGTGVPGGGPGGAGSWRGGAPVGRGPGRAAGPRPRPRLLPLPVASVVLSLTRGTAERRGGARRAGQAPGHAAHGRQGPARPVSGRAAPVPRRGGTQPISVPAGGHQPDRPAAAAEGDGAGAGRLHGPHLAQLLRGVQRSAGERRRCRRGGGGRVGTPRL